VWADWNLNNVVDAGEQIATNTSIATAVFNSNQVLSVTPPATVATGTVPLRARFTNTATPGFSNTFPGTTLGEVEDHLLTISAPNLDFGDYSGFAAASQVANATILIGSVATDAEVTNPSNSTATGDDVSGSDDEDLVMPAFTVGSSTNLVLPITNTAAVAIGMVATVIVFVDWNGDGDVSDAGETLAAQTANATGNRTFALTPPVGTSPGTKYLRVRLAAGVGTPAFAGSSADVGEVEDYSITVINPTLTLGNLVWSDLDNDGIRDAGEPGLDGLTVDLLNGATDALITTTVTAGGGLYSFAGLTPGSFKVRIASPPLGHGLTSGTPVSGDNGVDNDNNGLQPGGINAAITTSAVTLGLFTEPGSSGSGIVENTLDIGLAQTMCVGNIVFRDSDHNGFYNTGDALLDGITVRIFASGADPLSASPVASTTTAGGGRYQLCVRPGSYFIHIPPAMFSSTLSGMVPSLTPAAGPVSNLDDNADQNLLPSVKPSFFGASTGVFTLAVGAAPNAAAGETGHQSTSDDSNETTVNLTLDLGLVASPVTVPVAGMVLSVPSTQETGVKTGVPLPGVQVSLYADTDKNGQLGDTEMSAVEVVTTNKGGVYSFDPVPPGTYLVVQETPPGSLAVSDSDGGDAEVTKLIIKDQPVTGLDFTIATAANTFQEWRERNGDSAAAIPTVDPLLQYALGVADGGDLASLFQWQWGRDGRGDLRVIQHRGDRPDVRLVLEGSIDLETWTSLSIRPEEFPQGESKVQLSYPRITTPFVRLKAVLDADLNGKAERFAVSPVFGVSKLSLRSGLQSFSMPFLNPPLAVGRVDQLSNSAIAVGKPCYAEVMAGAHVGRRYEIDEAASLVAGALVFESDAAPNAAETVVVRPHWTLDGLFPVGSFTPGVNAEVADRILFFREGSYRTIWLGIGVSGAAPRWVESTDTGTKVAGHLTLSPDEGLLIHPRSRAVTLPLLGEVRTWRLIHHLKTGNQLISVGQPIALNPAAARMTEAHGFLSGSNAASADGLRFWTGDRIPGDKDYDGYALLEAAEGGEPMWTAVTPAAQGLDSRGHLRRPVFDPFRAAFVTIRGAGRVWQQHGALAPKP
jgi:hypothetical protein